MARMSDEQYLFIQDCKDKKITARSARHTRTHCGKGGTVKFPSDYMTKKELKAMSGECKTYKMNEAITWDEFKKMPDDLKIDYVKNLREKFSVPDKVLAEHMGVTRQTFCNYMRVLGISLGSKSGGANKWWTGLKEFDEWWYGEKEEEQVPVEENDSEPDTSDQVIHTSFLIPKSGQISFEGAVDDILRSVAAIIGSKNVELTVHWNVID